jgi:DNA-binding transcriptional LysR family regulator
MLTRSMTVAATQLHTSQPNVSRIIGQLEGEVGFRLFERRSNGLLPTPEAEAFDQAVQRLFLGMGELADTARQIREVGAGTLRIGMMPSLVMSLMPKVMQAFRGRYPDAQVSIHSSDSSTVAKWVSTRYVDLGLVSNLIETPGVVSTLWATEEGGGEFRFRERGVHFVHEVRCDAEHRGCCVSGRGQEAPDARSALCHGDL